MNKLQKAKKQIAFVVMGALIFYVALILWGDVRKLSHVFFTFDFRLIPLLMLLTLLNYFIRFLRWHYLLFTQKIPAPFKLSLYTFLAGISMTITPGKMGEVVKSWAMKRSIGATYTKTMPIIVFERLTDGIAMVVLSIGGIILFKEVGIVYIIAFGSIMGFFLVVLFRDAVIAVLKRAEKKISQAFLHRTICSIESFLSHTRLLISIKTLSWSIFLGIIAWLCEGIALFLIIDQFNPDNLWLIFTTSLFLFSFSSILGFLVMIPGGIGVAESSISALLVWSLGMPLSQAVFIALLFRFTSLWFGVLISFPFFVAIIKPKST